MFSYDSAEKIDFKNFWKSWNWASNHCMLPALIMVTVSQWKEFIHGYHATVKIEAVSIVDLKSPLDSSVEVLERTYHVRQFTNKWLMYAEYSYNSPLLTRNDK